MTLLALNLSRHVNGVAKRHAEVSRLMFAPHVINAITNGVHAATWTSPPFAEMFDRHIPDWRKDSFSIRYALSIPPVEVRLAHATAKKQLLSKVNERAGVTLHPTVLTL
jgi:glycogen phosphorylase